MKFTVSSGALLKQLQLAGGALSSNPVIPVLEDFLFKLKGNKLSLAASNLEVTIDTTLEVKGAKDGVIAIPGKTLLETLKSMPEQPLIFTIDVPNSGIEITSSSGKYKLVGEKPDEFPEISRPTNEEKIVLEGVRLQKAIDKTIFATSNDEMRIAMKGVNLNIDLNHITFAATDAHKLVKYAFHDIVSKTTASIILTKKSLLALKPILPKDGDINIYFGKTKVFFEFADTVFATRLIEAKFPDYNAVIPVNNPNQMTLNRAELLAALKRLSVFANKTTNQVVLNMADNSLTVTAQDVDLNNEATEQIICTYDGEPMSIGLNAKFVVEMLSAIESENVIIEMSAPNKPAIILPVDQDPNEELLMLVVTNY